ncbi:MAG: toxin co-regulated pilus biosynthesis Q family protein [Burkholderiales bacterium]|nr:toxin co-regulated pilus biosynthesis Q family protein [Burkholderiales bacterium]
MKTAFVMVAAIATIFSMRAEADVQPMVPAKALSAGKQIIPIIDIGTPPTLPKEISGDGAHVPLSDALRMIMQFDGWHAFIEPGVDRNAPVLWHGGVPWTDALKNVAVQAGVTAEIDWTAKTVTLAPGKPVPPQTETMAPVQPVSTPKSLPQIQIHEMAPHMEWDLTPTDGTIKAALARWAREANWQMSWGMPNGEDFHFDQSATYAGSFEEAVRHLAISLKSSQMPIKAIFYRGNRVVRILPLSYGEN